MSAKKSVIQAPVDLANETRQKFISAQVVTTQLKSFLDASVRAVRNRFRPAIPCVKSFCLVENTSVFKHAIMTSACDVMKWLTINADAAEQA